MSTKVPTADMIELESLFGPLFDEYLNEVNQVISKSSAVTTADASDKRQQQPDSASSSNDCHCWRKLRLMNYDTEDDIMDPVMQCTTLPSHSGGSVLQPPITKTKVHKSSLEPEEIKL
ncbi:hypothetical protein Tco_0320971 [Tanacetum coccineum]